MDRFLTKVSEPAKTAVDLGAIAVVLTTLTNWLPPIAAALAIVWTGLRIWEIVRIKGWWRRRDE